ncbi:MAG: excinuclease ABC subunit A, partial [Muribaculaceae bacterium]|nr:excinuclease ABC subunit A [Muribaculaceae bacterium]
MSDIQARGVRVNNLKDVDVTIPRNKLVVITGLSGSGKSSLAFDTLYAEGRRRYVESLSAYARQFLGRLRKPEADKITGLPPAIAIEQKVNTRNPRSTVGTSTEIYDYMRLLFGRVGHTFSPATGLEVKKHSVNDILEAVAEIPAGTRMAVVAPLIIPEDRTPRQHLDVLLKGGYTRLLRNGEFIEIEQLLSKRSKPDIDGADLLIDRTTVSRETDEISRLAESAETALFEGRGAMALIVWDPEPRRIDFSTRFEADGITFIEPSEMMFNFNNPIGACPTCEGFGQVLGVDPELVIPDPGKSVYDDAVVCWRGEIMSEWKRYFIRQNPGFPIHTPYA